MSTPLHLKPPTAAWIVRERRRLGLKPRDVAQRLAAMGLDVTEATVKVWESNADRRPNPYNLEGLERIFDSKAPTEAVVPEGQSALVAEIRLLRAAVEAQTEAQTLGLASLGAALTAVFLQLGGQPGQSQTESSAPREARPGGK